MKEKIDILNENFDQMTDEGKDELLKIGEDYLKELNENEKDLGTKDVSEG
jgi:hypothetical protein